MYEFLHFVKFFRCDGAPHNFRSGSYDAAIPPIDDFGLAVVCEAAFDGEQGAGFGFRPAASRPSKKYGTHPIACVRAFFTKFDPLYSSRILFKPNGNWRILRLNWVNLSEKRSSRLLSGKLGQFRGQRAYTKRSLVCVASICLLGCLYVIPFFLAEAQGEEAAFSVQGSA